MISGLDVTMERCRPRRAQALQVPTRCELGEGATLGMVGPPTLKHADNQVVQALSLVHSVEPQLPMKVLREANGK